MRDDEKYEDLGNEDSEEETDLYTEEGRENLLRMMR